MTDYFQKTTTNNENIILNLDENKALQSPIKKVYFKDINSNSQNLSKENKKNNDSNISKSTNNNTFSISGNLSKISPLPKPDFSSITRFENSLSYKQKGSHKKNKLIVPNSPIKTPNKYAYTPNDKNYSQDNILQKSTCRKLNFFEGGETKENSSNKNTNAFRSITEKKDNSREFNGTLSFNQSTIPNLKTSEFLMKIENINGPFNLNNITPFSANSIEDEKIIKQKQNSCNSNLNLNFIKNNYYQISNDSNKNEEYKVLSADNSRFNKTSEFKLNSSNDNSFSNLSNFDSPSPKKNYHPNEQINNMYKNKRKRASNENITFKEDKKVTKLRMENV